MYTGQIVFSQIMDGFCTDVRVSKMCAVVRRKLQSNKFLMLESKSVGFKGFILTWFDAISLMDRTRLAQEVKQTLDELGVEDVEVEKKGEGVALTINKKHFIADQAVVLPEERPRLKALAETLK